MSMCVRDIDFAYFHDFCIIFHLEGLNRLMGRQPSTFIYIYLESYHFTTETTSTRVVEVVSKSTHSI
jgi:hypothetical protein